MRDCIHNEIESACDGLNLQKVVVEGENCGAFLVLTYFLDNTENPAMAVEACSMILKHNADLHGGNNHEILEVHTQRIIEQHQMSEAFVAPRAA